MLEIIPKIPTAKVVEFLNELKSNMQSELHIKVSLYVNTTGQITLNDVLTHCAPSTPVIPTTIRAYSLAKVSSMEVNLRVENLDDLIEIYTLGLRDAFANRNGAQTFDLRDWTNISINQITITDSKMINITMNSCNIELKVKQSDYEWIYSNLLMIKQLPVDIKILPERGHRTGDYSYAYARPPIAPGE
jgi:hypothetical protein